MTQNPPDMKVRLSADLRRNIAEAAARNNRTLNSEIVFRLENSFLGDGRGDLSLPERPTSAVDLAQLEKRIAALEKRRVKLTNEELDHLAGRVASILEQNPD